MIGLDAYYMVNKLKKLRFLLISIRDLKFQVAKKAKLETDLKSFILEDYNDCLDIFSKKDLDIFLFLQKYNYKINLEEK